MASFVSLGFAVVAEGQIFENVIKLRPLWAVLIGPHRVVRVEC